MQKISLLVLLILFCIILNAQKTPSDSSSKWKYSAWAEMFIFPNEKDVFNPTFYARTEKVLIEARYNYEDINTASVWGGRRFSFGKNVKFILVPMVGVVFGNTNGFAPGLEAEIMYKKFDFYAEAEQVFDVKNEEYNFFYMYSELAIRPIYAIRAGLIAQRTRLYESERELNHGVFAEYYYKKLRAGIFYFNPLDVSQYWIASFSVDF